jgi:hypothetical protein
MKSRMLSLLTVLLLAVFTTPADAQQSQSHGPRVADLSGVAIAASPAAAPPMLPPTTATVFTPVFRR